ncbi:hypothetical protein LUZ60_003844 [Juncus effusus]|nr:hypothetical protein LUZ60_003844 [Juncus effusus]
MLMRNSLFLYELIFGGLPPTRFRSLSNCASPKLELGVMDCNSEDLNQVCKIIDNLSNSDRKMEELFTESGVGPTQSLVVSILNRYRYMHRPSYRFFKWAGTVPNFKHDFVTYQKMLEILANTKQFETTVEFLEEMGNLGFLSMESLKIAIQSFASARETKKCLWVFQLMNRFGFDVNLENFNCLLNHLAEKKLTKEAQNLFDKMSDQYKPSLETYKILLYGWCKVKNLVKAGRVWNEMFEMGFKPDLITYNIMINGLAFGQRRNEAMKLFEFMKSNGPNPNLCTYSIIIGDLCKRGKMDLAIRVFEEMGESGFEPNLGIYMCLITGFGNINKMDKVLSLLDEMTEMGLKLNSWIYNSLIKLMTSRNNIDKAIDFYKMMLHKGVEPTIYTYNTIMKSYFAKNYETGCEIWYEIKNKGFCPDINSYTVFIRGHLMHNKLEEAEKYILEMGKKGMKMPQIDYNKFANDSSKVGKPEKLRELAEKMRFEGNLEAFNVLNRWDERIKTRV